MTTHRTTLGLLAAAAGVGGLTLVPSPALAANCKLTASEKYEKTGKKGPTYTRSLKVSGGATCATGHKMIGAYYRCRVAKPSPGKKGRCTQKVLGYSCKETRFNVIATQFDAKVTCKKGRARIDTEYTQFS